MIPAEIALAYGMSGPNLRASGVDWDLRRDQPYSGYENYDFEVAVDDGCDTWARYHCRLKEMRESCKLILALGSCSVYGGISGASLAHSREEILDRVYINNKTTKGDVIPSLSSTREKIAAEARLAAGGPAQRRRKSAKARAEEAVAASGAEAVIVRTSLIYGWRPTTARAAQWMIDALNKGETIRLWEDEMRCPIWVESLAAAIVELAGHDYVGPLHIAGAQSMSRYEFGVALLRFYGISTDSVVGVPSPKDSTRPLNCTLDSSLANRLLSTKLPGVDEVLVAG